MKKLDGQCDDVIETLKIVYLLYVTYDKRKTLVQMLEAWLSLFCVDI